MFIKRAIKPNRQLPRHLEATKRRGMVALATMCCSIARDPQLMKEVQHIGRVVSIKSETLQKAGLRFIGVAE
jgi:hypothetical protein